MTMLEFLGQMPFRQFDRLGIGALLQYRQDGEKAFRIARSDRIENFRISDVEPQRFGVEKAFEIGGKGLLVHQIGRASCRERVCQYEKISVVAGSLKQKKNNEQ